MNDINKLETDLATRTDQVIIRVTPEEKLAFVTEAQNMGISISAFIRLLLRNWSDGITFKRGK